MTGCSVILHGLELLSHPAFVETGELLPLLLVCIIQFLRMISWLSKVAKSMQKKTVVHTPPTRRHTPKQTCQKEGCGQNLLCFCQLLASGFYALMKVVTPTMYNLQYPKVWQHALKCLAPHFAMHQDVWLLNLSCTKTSSASICHHCVM